VGVEKQLSIADAVIPVEKSQQQKNGIDTQVKAPYVY